MFILICRYSRVTAYTGDDVTLSSHLSPETSALSMEIRWFRDTECIHAYNNGQVSVGARYEGRASLLTQELSRGNVSLTLKSASHLDTGIYSCQVITGNHKVEKSIHLYVSGMEPLSPELSPSAGPTLTEIYSTDMKESLVILELKKLLQQQQKELHDKTRELEATTEMLKTKSSLLLYMSTDLENVKQLANQTEENLKNVLSELETRRGQLEQLQQKLQEKSALVEELRVVVQEKEQHLGEGKKKHLEEHECCIAAEGLKNATQDPANTPESLQLLELKNVLQNKEEELADKSREFERMTGELTRMTKLLEDRENDEQGLAAEQDGCTMHMTGEMEMCFRELETLGQKLQEKNAQVEELQVILQARERELEEEKKRGGGTPENESIDVSYVVLSKMFQNPKEQLEDMESWISRKREKRRLQEEEGKTEVLEQEFLHYVSAVKELIGKKHEKILAWNEMMDVLQKKLEVIETDEERQMLEAQLNEALEMQKLGQEQIEQLTESLEEKRSDIEEKHKHEMEEIREKYSTLSKIQAETNILGIILPDVLMYFQNVAASEQKTQETRNVPVERETEVVNVDTGGSEMNNKCEESLAHESVEGDARQANGRLTDDEDRDQQKDLSNKMVNGVVVKTHEKEEEEEGQQDGREAN